MDRTITAAAVQTEPVWLDLDATVDKTISLIREAADNGADLVAFPETFLPGYPWWIWLDSPADGMRFVPRYAQNSMTSDGPQMDRIRAAARAAGIYVVLGYSAKVGGSLYMAQAFIDADGDLQGSGTSSNRLMSNAQSSAKAMGLTCKSIRQNSVGSEDSTAGSISSRCRSTRCSLRTKRSMSEPGRHSHSTKARPRH